jgi:two-component system OmpR family sensor kinase
MGLVALVLVAVAAVITTTTRSQLVAQIDDRLAAAVTDDRESAFLGNDGDEDHDDHQPPSQSAPPERQSDFYEGRLDVSGDLEDFNVPNLGGRTFAPPDVDLDDLDLTDRRPDYLTVKAVDGDLVYRVLAIASPDGDGAFLTALPFDDVQSTINRLLLIEVAGVVAILAVLGLVTGWMLRLGIRPIKQMTTTATTIATGDLSARADETAPAAESRELAVALNTMMGTIETALDERAASEGRLRRFVSDASHELRTPVTTIRGYAELYRVGGLEDRADLDDAMRRTEQEATRMARLVDDMLTLAKLDEHRPMVHQPVDLGRLARDAVGDARAVAAGRSIAVDADDTVIVLGDEDRLRQVMANLVNNAIAHTEPDVAVTVCVRANDGRAVVEVIDEGQGMPADVSERVTERFFRADPSRSRHRGGSGLGLSIVDATVSAHGGSMDVRSSPGSGTTVAFDLPLAD